MDDKQVVLKSLLAFRAVDKSMYFTDASQIMIDRINSLCNQVVDELIQATRDRYSFGQLKRILKEGISRFGDDVVSDTEDRESTCALFSDIAQIVHVPFRNSLATWLYGPMLGALVIAGEKIRGNEKISRIVYNDCIGCNVKLETLVIREGTSPSTDWLIAKCNSCGTYNIIPSPELIGYIRPGNYVQAGCFPKSTFSEHEAWSRLEQLKAWGKLT